MTAKPLAYSLAVVLGILAVATARADSKPKAAQGAVLYRDKGCARCHGAHGEGTLKAPALVDIRKNKVWTPDKISQQILHGGSKMPPFADALSDDEVGELVTFLRSKRWPAAPE